MNEVLRAQKVHPVTLEKSDPVLMVLKALLVLKVCQVFQEFVDVLARGVLLVHKVTVLTALMVSRVHQVRKASLVVPVVLAPMDWMGLLEQRVLPVFKVLMVPWVHLAER